MHPHWSERITEAVGSTASIVLHTVFFTVSFALVLFGISLDRVLLVLTTVVSLEAIYLALFIQMTVNRHTKSLEEVEEDIDEIQEDIDEINEEVDEISEDIDDIQEGEEAEDRHDKEVGDVLGRIQGDLAKLLAEIDRLKNK